jgi:hypothetical protein
LRIYLMVFGSKEGTEKNNQQGYVKQICN